MAQSDDSYRPNRRQFLGSAAGGVGALIVPGLVSGAASTRSGRSLRPALTPPAPAAGAGYTTLAFYDDFTSSNTIDVNNTGAPGYNWYTDVWFGQGVTESGNISVSNSVLTLGGTSGSYASIESAIAKAGSPYYTGTVFGSGAYFEASMAFDPAKGADAAGWPAFWSMAIESIYATSHEADVQWPGQAAGYEHFAELDFMEIPHSPYQSFEGGTTYIASIHDWSGDYNAGCAWQYNIVNNGNNVVPVGDVDWSQFNTYGVLRIPQSGSNPGIAQWWFNGNAGPVIYWRGPVGSPPLPGQSTTTCSTGTFTPTTPAEAASTYAILDQQRLAIALNTDPAWPLQVDWVQVWAY